MTGKKIMTGPNKNKYKTSFYFDLSNNKTIHDHLIIKFAKITSHLQ